MRKTIISVALASFTMLAAPIYVQAEGKPGCICRGYSDKSKCATLSGSNGDQNEFCLNCGWTYINTGYFSPSKNYCKKGVK